MLGKGVVSILQGRTSGARWAAGQTKSSVQQGSASGGQCQGRSAWCGAALWSVELSCLSYTLKVWSLPQLYLESGVLHPSGSFDKGLGALDGKWGICLGACLWVVPLCRHGCSDHMCRYLRRVSLTDVSALT